MDLIARYPLGPGECRRVYTHHGLAVFVDRRNRPPQSKRCEVFLDKSLLWFVGAFSAQNWAAAIEKATRAVDAWLDEYGTDKEDTA